MIIHEQALDGSSAQCNYQDRASALFDEMWQMAQDVTVRTRARGLHCRSPFQDIHFIAAL
jgi:hypothetical protein